VIRTLKFFKFRCHACGYVTLIPSYGKFEVSGPVHCEGCGKVVLVKAPSWKWDWIISARQYTKQPSSIL